MVDDQMNGWAEAAGEMTEAMGIANALDKLDKTGRHKLRTIVNGMDESTRNTLRRLLKDAEALRPATSTGEHVAQPSSKDSTLDNNAPGNASEPQPGINNLPQSQDGSGVVIISKERRGHSWTKGEAMGEEVDKFTKVGFVSHDAFDISRQITGALKEHFTRMVGGEKKKPALFIEVMEVRKDSQDKAVVTINEGQMDLVSKNFYAVSKWECKVGKIDGKWRLEEAKEL